MAKHLKLKLETQEYTEQHATTEQYLWVAVIERAVNDWLDLVRVYSLKEHRELYNFFFGGLDGYCGLVEILDTMGNVDGLQFKILKFISEIAKKSDIELLVRPDLHKTLQTCIVCNKRLPLSQFSKYKKSFQEEKISKNCLFCKDKGLTMREMLRERQMRLAKNFHRYKTTKDALRGEMIKPKTFTEWRQDPYFVNLFTKQKKSLEIPY